MTGTVGRIKKKAKGIGQRKDQRLRLRLVEFEMRAVHPNGLYCAFEMSQKV